LFLEDVFEQNLEHVLLLLMVLYLFFYTWCNYYCELKKKFKFLFLEGIFEQKVYVMMIMFLLVVFCYFFVIYLCLLKQTWLFIFLSCYVFLC